MTIATHPKMTLQEYLTYDDGTDNRYELIDGVLVEMGAESTINTRIAIFLLLYLAQLGIPADRLGIKQKIAVSSTKVTAREPDLIIHSEGSARALDDAPQALIQAEYPAPLVAIEIVSPGKPGEENYDRDYIEKRKEYAERGIPEYWIIDPSRQVVLVLTLQEKSYQEHHFTGEMAISSPTFPHLNLTADQVLNAGR